MWQRRTSRELKAYSPGATVCDVPGSHAIGAILSGVLARRSLHGMASFKLAGGPGFEGVLEFNCV